jgi:hypothetical protein
MAGRTRLVGAASGDGEESGESRLHKDFYFGAAPPWQSGRDPHTSMWGMLLGAQLSQHNINLSHTGVMVASNELGFLAYHPGRVNQNVYFPRQFSNLLNPSEAALSEEPKA